MTGCDCARCGAAAAEEARIDAHTPSRAPLTFRQRLGLAAVAIGGVAFALWMHAQDWGGEWN